MIRIVRRSVLPIAFAVAAFGAPKAEAVIVEMGEIESDGVSTTIDRWYFTIDAAGAFEIQLVLLPSEAPIPDSRSALKIYRDDGALDAGDFLVGDDGTAFGDPAKVSQVFDAGAYVLIAADYDLGLGEFGPIQTDAESTEGWLYEFASKGGGDALTITCTMFGTLDGGFTEQPRAGSCPSAPAEVSEPAVLPLLGAALLGAGVLQAGRWRRSRTRSG